MSQASTDRPSATPDRQQRRLNTSSTATEESQGLNHLRLQLMHARLRLLTHSRSRPGVSVRLEERGQLRERARELAVVARSLGAAPDEELHQALDL